VIARSDQLAEMTWLMCGDCRWARGRMIGTYWSATWAPLPPSGGGLIPATFTHLTRTVQAASRHERYRTKSNGSAGRWVMTDDSVALCTCGWKAHADTRDEARWRARSHRDSPISD
jgi:hypothetical protein